MNMVSERASHPLAMNNESLQVLAQWFAERPHYLLG